MVHRMSTLLHRTLREDPADAGVPSHRLLLRAGYLRQSAPGVHTWLPLGLRVLANVARLVREELHRIGDQEMLFGTLVPREQHRTAPGNAGCGDPLLAVRDRRDAEFVLGAGYLETAALLVGAEVSSYRSLPLALYQVSSKFRDGQPRSGLLRSREYLTADAYSFDVDQEGLDRSYQAHRDAFQRILDRLGVEYRIVRARSGPAGCYGEEFVAPTPSGEQEFVHCPACDYAATVEAATVAPPPAARPEPVPVETLHTPGAPGVADLVRHHNAHLGGQITAADILKCILFTVDGAPAVVLVPGDREVDDGRLAAALAPATVSAFGPEDFARRPDLVRGYVGPQGMADRGVPVYADLRVAPGTAWITGANRFEHHVRNVVVGRDFAVDRVVDVVRPRPGEPCPECATPLRVDPAVGVGRVEARGTGDTDALGVEVLGPQGRPVRLTMGCYRVGVSRLVAAIAEQTHDARGLAWPVEVAPYHAHLVALGRSDRVSLAVDLAERLAAAGLQVLVDDRDASPGVKLTDAELLGMPHVVVVGRGAAGGVVELRDRKTGSSRELGFDQVIDTILSAKSAK